MLVAVVLHMYGTVGTHVGHGGGLELGNYGGDRRSEDGDWLKRYKVASTNLYDSSKKPTRRTSLTRDSPEKQVEKKKGKEK